jgi:hypothetical protein
MMSSTTSSKLGKPYTLNLKDKKDQPYKGYITFDKDSGKTNFEFPGQYKARVEPAEAHKTQTAVNSEGKTNEATKNIKEPLKSGQQRPKNEKQQEQQENPNSCKIQRQKNVIQYENNHCRKTKRSKGNSRTCWEHPIKRTAT